MLDVIGELQRPAVQVQKSESQTAVQDFEWLKQAGVDVARSLLEDEDCIAALKAAKYDLILRDTVGWQTHLLSKMLDVPEVVRSLKPGSNLRGLNPMQGPTFLLTTACI